jgi:hypothetical protein
MSRPGHGPRPAPVRLREDEAAVSDVLGSLLMVGMTVIAAVGLGAMLLAFDGPADQLHADLTMRTDPGTGGWGTADETLQVMHLGGEPVLDHQVTIQYKIGATTRCFGARTGCTALGSAFADHQLTIGETWESPAVAGGLLSDTELEVQIAYVGDVNQLLAAGTVAGSTVVPNVADCVVDDDAPVGDFDNAGDLDTTDGTAAFTITLVADDECGAVNTAAPPRLHYRLLRTPPLSGVPDDYTDVGSDLGAMTWVPGVGFQKNIPAPSGLGWANAYGGTLEFYASGLADTNAPTANVADTAIDTEFIQLIGSQNDPPDTITLVAGQFTAAGPASNLNTDNGANAILQEACVLDQPGTPLFLQTLCGTVAGGVSVTNANNAFFNDAARSTHSGSNSYVEVSGFGVPGQTGDITTFTINWKGFRAGGSGPPTLAIEANFGPDYSATSAGWKQVGLTVAPNTGEQVFSVIATSGGSLGGPWTDDQFDNLHVRARVNNGATRTVSTDYIQVVVDYPGSATMYDVFGDFQWTGLSGYAAASDIRQLSIQYQVVSGESYILEVANDAAGSSFTTCWTLNQATLTTPTACNLSVAQVNAGPWVRIRQAASNHATTPNSLQIDYLHMLVVT